MRGLSYSSFTEYSACARKWFLRKVAKVPIDTDADASTEAFDIGKSFHKCLEDTKHDLVGYTFDACRLVCAEFGIKDIEDVAMIFAMISKYKRLHEISKLEVLACEIVVDAPGLYGVVDVVMRDAKGKIWVIDLKTASTFQQSTVQTITRNPQLNLYAKHFDLIAYAVGAKDAVFGGVRLRTTTKSKLQKKADEGIAAYVGRMAKGIRSNEIVVPAHLLTNIDNIYEQHQKAHEVTSKATLADEAKFAPNYSNCNAYFRSCEYHSKCFKFNITEAPKVEVIEV